MSGEVRIGTSGWNYPKGRGTWNGVFYPKTHDRPAGFDELEFYSRHFNTVEVNSTFYGQPRPAVCAAWVERTPPGFEFSVKLYQKFTHPKMFDARLLASLPEELRGDAASVEALARPTGADIDEFKRGIEPLGNAGKLGALLAQFPPSFHKTPATEDYLARLLGAWGSYPVAVEVRHKSWSDDPAGTLSLLNGFGSAWVQIDEPKFRFSIRQNQLPNVRGFYYMRLHGRNAAQWWTHEASEDRYNYLYTDAELGEFSHTLDAARHLVKKTYTYTNNHFSAKSVANAVRIKRQLGEPIEGEYTAEFVAAFPAIADIVQRVGVNPSRTS